MKRWHIALGIGAALIAIALANMAWPEQVRAFQVSLETTVKTILTYILLTLLTLWAIKFLLLEKALGIKFDSKKKGGAKH